MRKIPLRHSSALMLLALMFVLWFFFARTEFQGGGWCARDLTFNPTQGHQLYTATAIRFPAPLVVVAREGCFDARKTEWHWRGDGLVVDLLFLVAIVSAQYWLTFLARRLRR